MAGGKRVVEPVRHVLMLGVGRTAPGTERGMELEPHTHYTLVDTQTDLRSRLPAHVRDNPNVRVLEGRSAHELSDLPDGSFDAVHVHNLLTLPELGDALREPILREAARKVRPGAQGHEDGLFVGGTRSPHVFSAERLERVARSLGLKIQPLVLLKKPVGGVREKLAPGVARTLAKVMGRDYAKPAFVEGEAYLYRLTR